MREAIKWFIQNTSKRNCYCVKADGMLVKSVSCEPRSPYPNIISAMRLVVDLRQGVQFGLRGHSLQN